MSQNKNQHTTKDKGFWTARLAQALLLVLAALSFLPAL